jgi:hypothetical protein
MTQLQDTHQWQTEQIQGYVFRGLPLFALLPGFMVGARPVLPVME